MITKILSEEQIKRLHETSLAILKRIGVIIPHKIILERFADAGADVFGHMGICGVDQAASLDMLILQNEIIGYIKSALREIDLSDDALGLNLLTEVGPGGMFIDHEHTAEHFRRELWFPTLLDRDYYQAWLEKGASGVEARCKNFKTELLKQCRPNPLPEPVGRAITEIVRKARELKPG